jgi:hypothetical protein
VRFWARLNALNSLGAFFCPPQLPTTLVLRRREAASKDAPMRTDVAESWNMLRDAALPRGSLSHEVSGGGRSETSAWELGPPVLRNLASFAQVLRPANLRRRLLSRRSARCT